MTSPSGSSAAGQAVASDQARADAANGTAGQGAGGQGAGGQSVAGQGAGGQSVAGQGAGGQGVAGQGKGGQGTALADRQVPGAGRKPRAAGLAAGGYDPGPAWARYLPPLVALAFALWGITTPSFWRDEAATIAAVRRPFGDLIMMLGNVDAVHSLYYMMMWPIEHLFGPGELVLRFPSAVAAAVAAAGVAAIGRRLISPWAGLVAGLILAVLPVTSRYGQEARSYELVVAMATIASYLLIRVLQADAAHRRRLIIGYGASIGLLGVLNIFGLLLVPAHALTVALYLRRDYRNRAARGLAAGWVLAALVGVIMASPLLAYGWMQRAQIAWLSVNTSSSGLNTLFSLSGSYLVTTGVIAVVAIALVLGMDRTKEQRHASWPGPLVQLSLPWLIVPPFILFTVSVVHPVYTSRYVLMCIPALALVVGAAISCFGRVAGAIAVAVVLLAGVTAQAALRGPAGHFDDIKALDQIVAARAKPGDAVLYTNPNAESFGYAYPGSGLGTLPNIGVVQGPIKSGTLAGSPGTLAQVRAKLAHYKRVWVVEINTFNADPQLVNLKGLPVGPIIDALPFSLTNSWQEHGDYLLLFTRS